MDVQDELRQLEERRQVYLSTVQDPTRTRFQREEALGDLELTEAKIAILPGEVHSSKETDDLLLTLERSGIDIYEDSSSAKGAGAALEAAEAEVKEEGALGDEMELDLTPGLPEKTNDPVRIYLREMSTVPLLTREGEVALAKRIERGQFLVLKTITRSPVVIKELPGIADDVRNGARSVKEILWFDDEELTEEKVENKARQTLKILDKIAVKRGSFLT